MNDLIEQPLPGLSTLPKAISKMDPVLGGFLEELMDTMPLTVFESKLDEIGEYCSQFGHDECPHEYDHQFPEGIYYREVRKKAGELVLGARHRFEHQNILLHGKQILFTNDGPIPMIAPFSFVGSAGSRKLTLTITDVVFANVFTNSDNCRDVDELVKRLTIEDDLELKEKEVSV